MDPFDAVFRSHYDDTSWRPAIAPTSASVIYQDMSYRLMSVMSEQFDVYRVLVRPLALPDGTSRWWIVGRDGVLLPHYIDFIDDYWGELRLPPVVPSPSAGSPSDDDPGSSSGEETQPESPEPPFTIDGETPVIDKIFEEIAQLRADSVAEERAFWEYFKREKNRDVKFQRYRELVRDIRDEFPLVRSEILVLLAWVHDLYPEHFQNYFSDHLAPYAEQRVRMLISGLNKLAPYEGTNWRWGDMRGLRNHNYVVGETVTTDGFVAAATSEAHRGDNNANFNDGGIAIEFEIHGRTSRHLGTVTNEGEYLFLPKTRFQVTQVTPREGGRRPYVVLQELTEPPPPQQIWGENIASMAERKVSSMRQCSKACKNSCTTTAANAYV